MGKKTNEGFLLAKIVSFEDKTKRRPRGGGGSHRNR